MAEKTDTKKLESEKEARESPIADAAQEIKEEKGKVTEKDLQEKTKEILEENNVEMKPSKKMDRETKRKLDEDERLREKLSSWVPKTKLGRKVKSGEIKSFNEILENNFKILEEEIVDKLLNVKSDLISMGQSKGKFGGGKRRAWRQTQRKTKEENVPTFSAMAVVGDGKGHVGIGTGRAKETLPARDKAIRKAKLNLFKVNRACSSFDCACSEKHTVPFKVKGKSGSVRITLLPAPQGTGLVVGNELKKILLLAGIKDVYSKTEGKKQTTFNFVKACVNALEKTSQEEKRK